MPQRFSRQDDEDQTLDRLIGRYLQSVDAGAAIPPEALIAQHPDHESGLRRYFENVAILEELAASGSPDEKSAIRQESSEPVAGRRTDSGLGSDTQTSRDGAKSGGHEHELPAEFGRYRIVRRLGQGAMGDVYVAHDPQLDREVALKVPRFQVSDSGELLERFYREARSAARLRHPNICPVYEVGEVNGRSFISMALIDGFTLKEFARAGTPQPQRDVALVTRKLALALGEAHRQGIIHRDLKSANIIVDKSGEPIVTDFGLARSASTKEIDITQSGIVLGTPAYMSPEQVQGDQSQIGPATDVYSLGIVLYELLTGQLPFTGTLHSILPQIISNEPHPPSRLRPDLDRQLEAICLKAMEKRIEYRYQSMDELAEDLRRFVAQEATLARPAGRLGRASKWVNRLPLPIVLVGLVGAAVMLGTALAVRGFREQSGSIPPHNATRSGLEVTADESMETSYTRALLLSDRQGREITLLRLAQSLQAADDAKDEKLASSIRGQLGAWRQDLWCLHQVFPHGGHLFAVAVSPTGDLVATAGADRTARLWNAATGESVGAPLQHDETVFAVAFSPDGTKVLTGSGDGTAQIWDTASGRRLGPRLRHQDRVLAVAFSPNGDAALTGSHDGTARLWDAVTGDRIGDPLEHGAIVRCVAFSPDGKSIATAGDDATARLWNREALQPTGRIFRQRAAIFALAFSPDGNRLLTGSSDCRAQLWDVASGNPVGTSLEHRHWVMAVGISPDGRMVMTTSQDQTVGFWDLGTGIPVGRLQHRDEVRAAAFGPDANLVVTGCWDGAARLWRMVGPTRLKNERPVRSAAFGADGVSLLTVGARSLRHWDLATGRLLRTLLEYDQWMTVGVISPDARNLFTADVDGIGHVWDVGSGQLLTAPLPHSERIRVAAFSNDSELILTASHHGPAWIRKAATGEIVGGPLQHRDHINGAVFSADGQTVLTASHDKTVQLWEVATGRRLGSPMVHRDIVVGLACSPDNSIIATSTLDGRVQFWSREFYQPTGPSIGIHEVIRSMTFSPDGAILITGSDDGAVCLWDAATGERLGPRFQHPSGIESVIVSPDGRTLLTRCEDLSVWLHPLFQPMDESPEELLLWSQVVTGMELDENGNTRVLDLATWMKRREELAVLR